MHKYLLQIKLIFFFSKMERFLREFSRKAFHLWSRIWEENQNLIAEERVTFPKIADYEGLGNS